MHNPLWWLYNQHGGRIIAGPASCYLCGTSCEQASPVSRAIADTFNSHYLARCPWSSWLCPACTWYLDSKAGHPDFRKMSLVVELEAWRNWQREQMKVDLERWLTEGLPADAYLVVSLSKKKHILLQAPRNAAGSTRLAVQVEEQVAHIDRETWQAMHAPFLALLGLGHGKGEILSGDLYAATLRKHGQLAEAFAWNTQLEPWRASPQIELLSYVITQEMIDERRRSAPGGGDTSTVRTGVGDQAHRLSAATGDMERHRPGVSLEVSGGNMAAIRGEDGDSGTDYEQLSLFLE